MTVNRSKTQSCQFIWQLQFQNEKVNPFRPSNSFRQGASQQISKEAASMQDTGRHTSMAHQVALQQETQVGELKMDKYHKQIVSMVSSGKELCRKYPSLVTTQNSMLKHMMRKMPNTPKRFRKTTQMVEKIKNKG